MGDVKTLRSGQARDHPQGGSLGNRSRSIPLFSTTTAQHKSALSELHSTVRRQQQVIFLQQQQLRQVETRNQVLLRLVSALAQKLNDKLAESTHEPNSSYVFCSPCGSEVKDASGSESAHLSAPNSKAKHSLMSQPSPQDAREHRNKKRKAADVAQSSVARAAAAVASRVMAARAAAAAALAETRVTAPHSTAAYTDSNQVTAAERSNTSLSDEEVQQILQQELMQQLMNKPPAASPGCAGIHQTPLQRTTAAPDPATTHTVPASVPAASGMMMDIQFSDVLQCPDSNVYPTYNWQKQNKAAASLPCFGLREDLSESHFPGQPWVTVADCGSGTLPELACNTNIVPGPAAAAQVVDSSNGNAFYHNQNLTAPFNTLDLAAAVPEAQTTATAATAAVSNISSSTPAEVGEFDDLLDLSAFGDPMDCFDWML